MAKANTPLMNDEKRQKIAVRATYEIDALTGLLEREISRSDEPEITALLFVISRLSELNCLVMSAVDDDLESTESLQIRYGELILR